MGHFQGLGSENQDAAGRVGQPGKERGGEAAGLAHPLDAAEGLGQVVPEGAQALAAKLRGAVGDQEVKGEEAGLRKGGGGGGPVQGELAQEGGAVRAGWREGCRGGGKVEHLVRVGVEEGVLAAAEDGEEESGFAAPGGRGLDLDAGFEAEFCELDRPADV